MKNLLQKLFSNDPNESAWSQIQAIAVCFLGGTLGFLLAYFANHVESEFLFFIGAAWAAVFILFGAVVCIASFFMNIMSMLQSASRGELLQLPAWAWVIVRTPLFKWVFGFAFVAWCVWCVIVWSGYGAGG